MLLLHNKQPTDMLCRVVYGSDPCVTLVEHSLPPQAMEAVAPNSAKNSTTVHCVGSLNSYMNSNLYSCICSDTSLLATCFAQQHWIVVIAFCQEQCCSALVLGDCTYV